MMMMMMTGGGDLQGHGADDVDGRDDDDYGDGGGDDDDVFSSRECRGASCRDAAWASEGTPEARPLLHARGSVSGNRLLAKFVPRIALILAVS